MWAGLGGVGLPRPGQARPGFVVVGIQHCAQVRLGGAGSAALLPVRRQAVAALRRECRRASHTNQSKYRLNMLQAGGCVAVPQTTGH